MPNRARLNSSLAKRIVVTASAVLLAAAAQAAPPAGEAAESFGIRGPAVSKATKPARPAPSSRLGVELGSVPLVALSTVDNDELLLEDQLTEKGPGLRTKVLRYGIGRDVVLEAIDGAWTNLPDGARLWVAELVSPNALGLRLHVADAHLPQGAELAIYGPDDANPPEVHFGSPVSKSAFWTGTVGGDRARVEYLTPAGSPDALPFRLDRLQHLYRDPVAELSQAKAAGPCHNQVSCFPEWVDLSRAVSGVGFIGANSLFCTGQLLNVSGPSDFTPYWLTANHCMDNPGDAESAEFFWLYQTASCGGTPPALTSVPRSQGASLVSTGTLSDYTLLIVEGVIPAADLFWAGWTSKEPANGVDAVAIHHPQGEHKRISFGFKSAPPECSFFPGFGGRKLLRTDWTNAVTEPGSSGSGIFRQDTGQLYGQLLGGPSSCSQVPEGLFDCYGAFATTFTKIKKPLQAGSDDKSEQNDTCAKARVVKAGTLGSRIVKVLDEDWYKVTVKPGQTVFVDLSFADGNGDVDLQSFAACGGEVIAQSTGTSDSEGIGVTNVGTKPAFLLYRVFLADDTRNSYDMNVHFE